MIRSMTGFGRAKRECGGRDIIVELKSVNNRYLDTNVKISRAFSYLEDKVKSRITARGITRGKLDVFITIDVLEQDGIEIKLDETYAAAYIAALKKLGEKFDLDARDITVMNVAQNRDIFAVKKADEDAEREWQNLLPVLDEALDMFIASREKEGANMKADIVAKRNHIEQIVDTIGPLSEADKKNQFEKMQTRIRQLIGDSVVIDEGRLLTECAMYADKIAIDEELVRLASHFKTFDGIVSGNEPVGRRLDFLLQEMNRETNTIGSKACDLEITRCVMEIKNELEKIREQIQNIE
ncbi:MAG: YicC family protein [Clostridia bacterium]|nr:YicC family protein [Clostridia bacterium]